MFAYLLKLLIHFAVGVEDDFFSAAVDHLSRVAAGGLSVDEVAHCCWGCCGWSGAVDDVVVVFAVLRALLLVIMVGAVDDDVFF